MRVTLLALSLAASLVVPAFAGEDPAILDEIEAIHGDSAGFVAIFDELHEVFYSGDPSGFAALAYYPLTVNANGETYDILSADDFVANVDSLLMVETREALADQAMSDLIVTSEGVGFANGAVWMSNVCLDDACSETAWGIISINN